MIVTDVAMCCMDRAKITQAWLWEPQVQGYSMMSTTSDRKSSQENKKSMIYPPSSPIRQDYSVVCVAVPHRLRCLVCLKYKLVGQEQMLLHTAVRRVWAPGSINSAKKAQGLVKRQIRLLLKAKTFEPGRRQLEGGASHCSEVYIGISWTWILLGIHIARAVPKTATTLRLPIYTTEDVSQVEILAVAFPPCSHQIFSARGWTCRCNLLSWW